MHKESKKQYWWTFLFILYADTENGLVDTENGLVDTEGDGESWTNWESITDIYTMA